MPETQMRAFDHLAKNPQDTDMIERLAARPPEEVIPQIPALLECLQDINWPIAGAALPILMRYGVQTAQAVRPLLNAEQHDDVWKYWLVEALFPQLPPDARDMLTPFVRRIADQPAPGERAEEVDRAAREQLERI